MPKLTREEQETHFNLLAPDRINGVGWEVYTDDPTMVTRLDKVATAYRVNGESHYYRLQWGQVRLFQPRDKGQSSVLSAVIDE